MLLSDSELRGQLREWLVQVVPRYTLERCEAAACADLQQGATLGWITCECYGHPVLSEGPLANWDSAGYACHACGVASPVLSAIRGNPLAAWEVQLSA